MNEDFGRCYRVLEKLAKYPLTRKNSHPILQPLESNVLSSIKQALSEGWIASAGLDDTEEELAKLNHWSPKDNPLFSLDNCVITPHVAYVSEEALRECRRIAAENARVVLLGETPPNLVHP